MAGSLGCAARGTADLLRAPLLGQPVDDERVQFGVAGDLVLFGLSASLRGEAWAWNGRYVLVVWRLRRSSRLIVDAALASARLITVGPSPLLALSAIRTRSSSERNRGEIGRTARGSSGGTTLTVPSFRRTVVPLFQVRAADRLTPHLDGSES